MAPISPDHFGWAISAQPEAAFLSIIVLFIISIALLVLCASCKKHSFALESNSAPAQKSSTLVSVARMGDSSGVRHNPAANEITGDEIGLEPEDLTISQGGILYKPWRSHTLSQDGHQLNVT